MVSERGNGRRVALFFDRASLRKFNGVRDPPVFLAPRCVCVRALPREYFGRTVRGNSLQQKNARAASRMNLHRRDRGRRSDWQRCSGNDTSRARKASVLRIITGYTTRFARECSGSRQTSGMGAMSSNRKSGDFRYGFLAFPTISCKPCRTPILTSPSISRLSFPLRSIRRLREP